MIDAVFFVTEEGHLLGFEITGHSDYAASGSDIICAAVSSVAYMAANTVVEVLHVFAQAVVEDAKIHLTVEKKDAGVCRVVFEGLKLHLQQLAEQYPDNINVHYLEVSLC